jgi:NAD(P)-dependent dehydrogenase (short-subunit alcohol dehydrogenase family)
MSKVVLITDAGRGLGAGIARRALAAGHRVAATGRDPDRVLEALGGDAGADAIDAVTAQAGELLAQADASRELGSGLARTDAA